MIWHFISWSVAGVVEVAALALALFVVPSRVPKHKSARRWTARLLAVGAAVVLLHGRQLYGAAALAVESVSAPTVSQDPIFCSNFDLVEPGSSPTAFNEVDVVEGEEWQFIEPLAFVDTYNGCGPRCAAWSDTGFVRNVFVGPAQDNDPRIPYRSGDFDLDRLTAGSVVNTDRCHANVRRFGFARQTGGFDAACVQYSDVRPAAPLLFTTMEFVPEDIGLGVTRARMTSTLREYFSHAVVAQSHMTMMRGMAPTLLPDVLMQHRNKGRLLNSLELFNSYRSTNCPASDGGESELAE